MSTPAPALRAWTLHDLFNAAQVTAPIPGADRIALALTPRDYQIRHLNSALYWPRFADYSEMGTGKSFTAYAYLAFYLLHEHRAVIVMPPPLLTQFRTELHATLRGLRPLEHVLKESPKARDTLFTRWEQSRFPDWLYLSYERFRKEWPRLAPHYHLLVCDEAHVLKNHRSKVFKAVERFMSCSPKKQLYLMTGDPIPNTLEDTYALIRLVTPDTYRSKDHFDRLHVRKEVIFVRRPDADPFTTQEEDPSEFTRVTRVVGFDERERLSRNLFRRAARITKDQALGPRAVQTVPVNVELNKAHQRLYDQLLSERLLEIGPNRLIDATTAQALRMHALRLITQPEHYSETPPGNAVWDTLEQLLESSATLRHTGKNQNKALIFCHFTRTVEALAERLRDAHPALLYGKSKAEDARRKFLEDPECRVCIAHPKSGGYGFNFQGVCHTVFFFEPPTTPGDFKQCLSRVDRSGQKHPVSVYLFQVLYTLAFSAVRHMIEKGVEANYVQRDGSRLFQELWGGSPAPRALRRFFK